MNDRSFDYEPSYDTWLKKQIDDWFSSFYICQLYVFIQTKLILCYDLRSSSVFSASMMQSKIRNQEDSIEL